MHGVIKDAGGAYRRAVREVAAVAKIHAQNGVARFQKRQEDGGVGLRP